jgi:hypothetical protein
MQGFNPVDPIMIIIYGTIIAIAVWLYALVIREPGNPIRRSDNVSSMAGGRVDEITTGAVQVPMLDHTASVEEERRSEEGCELGDPNC